MDWTHWVFFYLSIAVVPILGVSNKPRSREDSTWHKRNLPRLLVTHTELLSPPSFNGKAEPELNDAAKVFCGIECQNVLPSIDQTLQETILGYETLHESGACTHTDVQLQWSNDTFLYQSSSSPARVRKKRQVYGEDGRFVISDSQFVAAYPFSTAVRISSGCSGVLVSPKHVLTAAHCIHDGTEYLETSKKLKVGVLQLKTRRRREGMGRRKRRPGKPHQTPDVMKVEGRTRLGQRKRRRDRTRMRRGRKRGERKESSGPQRNSARRRRDQSSSNDGRHTEGPVFRWARVKQIHIPQGWIHTNVSTHSLSPDYDYALLQLKRPLKQKHMELGVAPSTAPLSRIHFSSYDFDKSLMDGALKEKVVYRFCTVTKESDDLMYQHCDAQHGATGAGIYIRLKQDGDGEGKWKRKVIGVFTGHRWVQVEGGEERDYNVAVRITAVKYAQICLWIHKDPRLCEVA